MCQKSCRDLYRVKMDKCSISPFYFDVDVSMDSKKSKNQPYQQFVGFGCHSNMIQWQFGVMELQDLDACKKT